MCERLNDISHALYLAILFCAMKAWNPVLNRISSLNQVNDNEKSAQRDAKAVEDGAKNFRPAADPLPGGAGRPKYNQLHGDDTLPTNPVW